MSHSKNSFFYLKNQWAKMNRIIRFKPISKRYLDRMHLKNAAANNRNVSNYTVSVFQQECTAMDVIV